jgi:hypothetical protein
MIGSGFKAATADGAKELFAQESVHGPCNRNDRNCAHPFVQTVTSIIVGLVAGERRSPVRLRCAAASDIETRSVEVRVLILGT